MKSYNTMDIAHKFCGSCNKFHDSPNAYDLGPTPESLPRGFSWTDTDGQSWHCMQRMAGHPQHQCPSCIRIQDDPILTKAGER